MDNVLLIKFAIVLVVMWYATHRLVYEKGDNKLNRLYFIIASLLVFIVMYNCVNALF